MRQHRGSSSRRLGVARGGSSASARRIKRSNQPRASASAARSAANGGSAASSAWRSAHHRSAGGVNIGLIVIAGGISARKRLNGASASVSPQAAAQRGEMAHRGSSAASLATRRIAHRGRIVSARRRSAHHLIGRSAARGRIAAYRGIGGVSGLVKLIIAQRKRWRIARQQRRRGGSALSSLIGGGGSARIGLGAASARLIKRGARRRIIAHHRIGS